MKRFLNRIARSIITAAGVVARLTDDQSSQTPSSSRDGANDIRDEQSFKDKDPLSTEAPTQSQQDFISSEPPRSTYLPDLLRDDGLADQSQPTRRCDDILDESEATPEEDWISFADTNKLFESNISLDTNPTTAPGLNQIHTEESPVQSNAELDVASGLLDSEPLLPIHASTASLVEEISLVASASETSVGSPYSDFDISLSDLEEKFEATWQEDAQFTYGSTIQSEFEPPGLPRYEEAVEEIERAQASHEFDLDLADLEVRQQSTWHDYPSDAAAEKPFTLPTNVESGDDKDRKSSLDSKVNSNAQLGSIYRPGIQGVASLHEPLDDHSVFRRIKLRPNGLEELKLRQSGALTWDHRWDPEDYIWALDGVGYFDNIWNVEGFFESMVGEAEDRYHEALYWSEY
jgi:hypothetical protein